MYDFTLFFEDCKDKYNNFDDFADACENIDPECAIDYDGEDVTFYDFSFDLGYRAEFCRQILGDQYTDIARHQIAVQREFNLCMNQLFF